MDADRTPAPSLFPAGPDFQDETLREQPLASEPLLQGRFLRVQRDTVRLPGGQHGGHGGTATREYVRHPGAAVIAALLEDGQGGWRVVLERQWRHPLGQAIIELPAGKLDPGEPPLHCAQRELREETGYTAREWACAGLMHPTPAYSTEGIHLWFARGLTAGPRQLDAGEHLHVFTATVPELLDWCRQGRVTDSKTLAAALWLQNYLSGAWPLDWQRDESA